MRIADSGLGLRKGRKKDPGGGAVSRSVGKAVRQEMEMRRAGSPFTFAEESGARRPWFTSNGYAKLREATGVGRKAPTHMASEPEIGFDA